MFCKSIMALVKVDICFCYHFSGSEVTPAGDKQVSSLFRYAMFAIHFHGYGYKNGYISVSNKARHKSCVSLEL